MILCIILCGFLSLYIYLETGPSTVSYIMPGIGEMMQFWCPEIICKFRQEIICKFRQLFYTFNEITQQTFDKTKCRLTIFTNIEILRM